MSQENNPQVASVPPTNRFNRSMEAALTRDPDVLIVGEASERSKETLKSAMTLGHVVRQNFTFSHDHMKRVMDLARLRRTYPAESEVGLDIIRRDKNATLPARVRKLLAKQDRLVVYTMEDPVEYHYSMHPAKKLFLNQDSVTDEA